RVAYLALTKYSFSFSFEYHPHHRALHSFPTRRSSDLACPTLRLLVTSRERLNIGAEIAWPVPPLAPPDAQQLFMERARSAGAILNADETVAQLCRRLDNLPLALELAASRIVVFNPPQLLERLSERLDLLRGG